jgi:LysM repeat protein
MLRGYSRTLPHATARTVSRSRCKPVAGTRWWLLAGMALLILAAAQIHGARAAAAVPTRTYVVQAGDTLWEIARRIAPQDDPRTVIAEIEQLNNLGGDARITPGQVLRLPDA